MLGWADLTAAAAMSSADKGFCTHCRPQALHHTDDGRTPKVGDGAWLRDLRDVARDVGGWFSSLYTDITWQQLASVTSAFIEGFAPFEGR